MKTFRWIIIVFVAVTFVTGVTSVSWSERKIISAGQPSATIQTTSPKATATEDMVKIEITKQVTRTCPPGWHVGTVDTFGWTCEPDSPPYFECPEGYDWRKTGECAYVCESVETPR